VFFTVFKRLQYWLLAGFVVAFAFALAVLLRSFIRENTVWAPVRGGTYIEGSVGGLQPLNPWFTVTNDVNRDIGSLVFSGLLKYNPETKKIEDDLAEMTVSGDGGIYTLKLKENLFWHDTTDADPHPVTAQDALFTFETIQHPDFPNTLLRQNFLGIKIDALDGRTVRFKLDEPYHFFASNLTIGLLPERSFESIPVSKIDQALDFGFAPVGAGPYAFKSLVQTELSTEVTLERFERSLPPDYKLDRIVFRIFPDFTTLLSDIRNMDGVRLVPRNESGEPIIPRRFRAAYYSLPQYVALFFNLESDFLKDQKLRLGLQLGTDKQAIADALHEKLIVDTPLLEIDTSDWRYQFAPAAAQGAFYESNWHLPEKIRLQRLLEMREANDVGPLHIDPIVLLDTGAVLAVTGLLRDAGSGALLNGTRVERHPTETGAWIAALSTYGGTGSLRIGDNIVRLTRRDGSIVDSFYVWRTADARSYKRAAEEQRLLELFIHTRDGAQGEERVTVRELFLDKGMLRRRLSTDPTDIRMNDGGERLSLRLLTSPTPPAYADIARMIQTQWADLGVHVGVDIAENREVFEEKLINRDYDVLLFGQSLLDNLDSYPYWHSSGMQKSPSEKSHLRIDAYNLSQYSSLRADALLETIRTTHDDAERMSSLNELRAVLRDDVPAVFLYSPLYAFAYHQDLKGIEPGAFSLHSDRFLTLQNWYMKEERVFQPNRSWWSFFGWVLRFEMETKPLAVSAVSLDRSL